VEKRIGFGKRLLAYLIDIVLVLALSMVLGPIIGGVLGGAAGAAGSGGGADAAVAGGIMGTIIGAVAASAFIMVFYFIIEGFVGATLGKMILGIKIGTADGKNGSTGLYLTRYAIKNIGSLVAVIGLIVSVEIIGTIGSLLGLVILLGCFMALSSGKQALHDIAAKTAVYKKVDLA